MRTAEQQAEVTRAEHDARERHPNATNVVGRWTPEGTYAEVWHGNRAHVHRPAWSL